MLETGSSGLMSGEGKRAAASRPRTALFLDSTHEYSRITSINAMALPKLTKLELQIMEALCSRGALPVRKI